MEIQEQKKRVSTYFDESKGWQGDIYRSQGNYFSRVIIRRKEYALQMIKQLRELRKGKALDIGCGSGVYLEELLGMGFNAYGMDVAQEMLNVCKKLQKDDGSGPRLHLVGGDVEHIPFKDGEFDLVLCIGVLGYLLSDEKALVELKRIVKPGGYLLVNLTNMYSLSDFDFVWRKKLRAFLNQGSSSEDHIVHPDYAMPNEWMMKNRKYHFKSYNLWRYEKMVTGTNFTRVDAMSYGYEFRVLRRVKFIPESLLFGAELFLEKLFRAIPIPYFSYSGWVYTGIFQKKT